MSFDLTALSVLWHYRHHPAVRAQAMAFGRFRPISEFGSLEVWKFGLLKHVRCQMVPSQGFDSCDLLRFDSLFYSSDYMGSTMVSKNKLCLVPGLLSLSVVWPGISILAGYNHRWHCLPGEVSQLFHRALDSDSIPLVSLNTLSEKDFEGTGRQIGLTDRLTDQLTD